MSRATLLPRRSRAKRCRRGTSLSLAPHSENSTLRERIVEHAFVGDALRRLWRCDVTDVEILRSEFDAHGYDLVVARGKIVRHIQFKTGLSKTPGKVSVSRALAAKPSGCVIWIRVTHQLDMGPFFWFGNGPRKPLPAIDCYPHPPRTTRNKEGVRPLRINHHEVPGAAFAELATLDDVLIRLLGKFRRA